MHCTVARRAVTMVAVPVLLVILSACSSAAGSRTLPGIAAPAGMPVSGTTSPLASPAAGGSVPASPAPGSPAPGSPTPAGATSAVPSSAGWAKTTQFLQIKGSGEAGGVEYLEVRQATQKPVGESFKTVPLDEAWIKVTISALAQNAPLYAKAGDSRQLRAALVSPFVGQRLVTVLNKEHYSGLDRLAQLAVRGEVVPSIERTYPLADAPDAVRQLEAGQVRGQVVIVP